MMFDVRCSMCDLPDRGAGVARPPVKGRRADSPHRTSHIAHRRCAGLSLIEMLISLAITAILLTATMVAIDASFRAYASAAETASKQTATRLVTHRLLTLVRTSTAHGPLEPSSNGDWPVTTVDGDQNLLESDYMVMVDSDGQLVRIEYRADIEELWVKIDDNGDFVFGSEETQEPLIGGVTDCTFHVRRRMDANGVLVLERGTVDLKVERDEDTTLALESGNDTPIRIIASTMPRKLD